MRRTLLAGLALLALGCSAPEDDMSPAPSPEPAPSSAPLAEPPVQLSAIPAAPFESAMGERMRAVTGTLVEVEALSGNDVVSHGSGVLVSAEGHVLTAAHVVKNKTLRYRVVLPDGQGRTAEVIERDEARDAALLRAPVAPAAFARVAAKRPEPGDWAVCAGYGGQVTERAPMRTAGVVVEHPFTWAVAEYAPNTRHPEIESMQTFEGMLRLDCATAPGMSGGPVVDLDGNLIGLIVGADGVATPIAAIEHLLPSAARASRAPSSPDRPKASPGAEAPPSRHAALAAMFASSTASRSIVELEVPDAYQGHRRIASVLVSQDGLVVAPSVRLAKPGAPSGTIMPENIGVVGRAGAQCTEIVAVKGDLALLRLWGLDIVASDAAEDGLRPIGPASAAALGSLVATVDVDSPAHSYGFVTAQGRHPGYVGPDLPRWGCGWRRGYFRADHPAVEVTSALAHDAGWPRLGSLLADRSGAPVAFAIAERAPGLAFAVPWPEVMARFDAWLRPSAPGAAIEP